MLTFTVNDERNTVEVHADVAGLTALREEIDGLLAGDDHTHLMTASWGGFGLTEERQGAGHLIHHVKIYRW